MHRYNFRVTDRQRNVIVQEYGHIVADPWLKKLPETVSDLCTRWNLTPTGVPNSGAMSACVYVADTENNHYVLKLLVHPEVSQSEGAALDAWGNQKLAPHIHRYDRETGTIFRAQVYRMFTRPLYVDMDAVGNGVCCIVCITWARVSMSA